MTGNQTRSCHCPPALTIKQRRPELFLCVYVFLKNNDPSSGILQREKFTGRSRVGGVKRGEKFKMDSSSKKKLKKMKTIQVLFYDIEIFTF